MSDTSGLNECDTGVSGVAQLKRVTYRSFSRDRDLLCRDLLLELMRQVRWTSERLIKLEKDTSNNGF